MTVSSDPAALRHDEPEWPQEPETPPTLSPVPSSPTSDRASVDATRASLPIGRLHRVDPVELWRSQDFAAWLGENLEEVGRLIGTRLTPAGTSGATPGTVVATDPDGGQVRVVVELGKSSDETFGLLMRQLVASGAKSAIWVCAEAGDEHLSSVEWLNREIAGHLHVVIVEAVRIDDSMPAPVFRLALRAGEPPAAAAEPTTAFVTL